MGEVLLKCTGVCKRYKDKEVLSNVDVEIEAGKIYGLIGRNGAGKTTLLSIITGQNAATSGEITYKGEKVWENQEVLDHICFSRELNSLLGMGANNLKVKDYLKAAAVYLPKWDSDMADKLVVMFELDKKKKICKLSKGMMSMITIIIAMASKAEITILDEPVAGLDVVMRETFYRLLLEEYSESNRTFIVSTHIIEEASGVFEDVIIVDKGKVLLNENEEDLLGRAYMVSGKAEEVDEATKGLHIYHKEINGRGKTVTVVLEDNDTIDKSREVTVVSPSLQNLFVALCSPSLNE